MRTLVCPQCPQITTVFLRLCLFGRALTQDTKLQMLFPPLTKQSHCFTSQFSTRRDQTKSYRFFDIFTSVLPPRTYFPPYTTMQWAKSLGFTVSLEPVFMLLNHVLFSEKVCTQSFRFLNLFYLLPTNLLVSTYDLKLI